MTLVVSTGLHGVLLACLMVSIWPFRARPVIDVQPEKISSVEIAGGSHPVPIRLPAMDTAARTRHPAPRAEAEPKNILTTKQPVQRPGGGSPAVAHAGDGAGKAIAGNGSDDRNARPAFPVFFPRPPITDRAMLPAHSQRVVVDVNIDVTGAVVSENLISGIGNALNHLVLETVKTWRFQPATVDGKPVPGKAELVFPFDRDYPITDS
jgi:TonB family protein